MPTLYRTHRPRRFSDVVGQETAVRILRNAVRTGRLGHAYLFSGPRGVGKTTLARILAMAANCADPQDGEPCLACPACANPDLHVVELDAASNRGIDEIRDLRERARFAPALGRRKTYILDEAHMLTGEAFNALLKILEEPPEHLLFVLATTAPERMPDTILSRCQRLPLRRLTEDEVRGQLLQVAEREGMALDPEAAAYLARRAEGSLRDGLALLDLVATYADGPIGVDEATRALGGVDPGRVQALLRPLAAKDVQAFLAALDSLLADGADIVAVADAILDHLRAELVATASRSPQEAVHVARRLSRFLELAYRLRQVADPRLLFEAEAIDIWTADGAPAPGRAQAPATAAASPPSPSPPTPAGPTDSAPRPFDVDALRRRVLRRSRTAAAVLETVRGEVQGGELVLVFAHRGHQIVAEQPEHRQVIAASVKEMMGKEIPIRFTVEAK
jgi:DNA polymerase-3 subunit gamma/tau